MLICMLYPPVDVPHRLATSLLGLPTSAFLEFVLYLYMMGSHPLQLKGCLPRPTVCGTSNHSSR